MAGEALWVVAVTAMACGLPLGLTLGFAFVAHQRVRAGWRPRTANRFVHLFFGSDSPRNSREAVLFCSGTLALVVLFFAVCALPFAVAMALMADARLMGPPIAAAFAVAGLVGQSFGSRLWLRYLRAV